MKHEFYTTNEVEKILRVSKRTLFRYIHSGKLRATKIGQWRINKKDLNIFLARQTNQKSKLKT